MCLYCSTTLTCGKLLVSPHMLIVIAGISNQIFLLPPQSSCGVTGRCNGSITLLFIAIAQRVNSLLRRVLVSLP